MTSQRLLVVLTLVNLLRLISREQSDELAIVSNTASASGPCCLY